MNKEEIFKKLLEIFKLVVSSNKHVKEITLQTRIIEDLAISSIAMVYLVFSIEKTFNISLSKIGYDTFKNVQDVVDLIFHKMH